MNTVYIYIYTHIHFANPNMFEQAGAAQKYRVEAGILVLSHSQRNVLQLYKIQILSYIFVVIYLYSIQYTVYLGGGFKCVLFSPLFGEDSQFD